MTSLDIVLERQASADDGQGSDMPNVYRLLLDRAERYPDAVATGHQYELIWQTLTSRQLLGYVDRLATDLAGRGVVEGDRVILWVPNHSRAVALFFALWKLGAIAVPFDKEMNPDGAGRIIAATTPRLIITGWGEPPAWDRDGQAVEWGDPDPDTPPSRAAWTAPRADLAAIYYTSGTTGSPKGCMIAHANILAQVEAYQDFVPLGPGTRLASLLPLSHLFELVPGMVYPLSQGAAIHYIPSRRANDILRVLAENRVTHMIVVPRLLEIMGKSIDAQLRQAVPGLAYRAWVGLADRAPFAWRRHIFAPVHRKLGGAIRVFISGGAPLAPETKALWERLGVRVAEGYGASECSPVIACGRLDGTTPAGSVGLPIRGLEVRVSPEGELQVRGSSVMRGYWHDAERTAQALQDGWYATGDMATLDERGNIYLRGRIKDMIVLLSGMKVWPEDIESALRQHPAVLDAAVVPTPSGTGGATLHAYLLSRLPEAERPDPAAVTAECHAQLAAHQRVATACWWPEPDFPRTPKGSIRRFQLPLPSALASAAASQGAGREADELDAKVAAAIAGSAHVPRVRDDQRLAELGFDSLALTDLALRLEEQTGKPIGDDDLDPELTVADVEYRLRTGEQSRGALARRESRTRPVPPGWYYREGRAFRKLADPLLGLFNLVLPRQTVLGREHLASLPANAILAGTHHSFADMPVVLAAVGPKLRRRLVISTAAEGFADAGPLATVGILVFGLYPLRPVGQREESLRGLARLGTQGNVLLVFPQGRHTHPDEEAPFKPGVAHLAHSLEAPVVPFGLAGTERVISPGVDYRSGLAFQGVPLELKRARRHRLRPGAADGPERVVRRLHPARPGRLLRPDGPGGTSPGAALSETHSALARAEARTAEDRLDKTPLPITGVFRISPANLAKEYQSKLSNQGENELRLTRPRRCRCETGRPPWRAQS